MKCHKKKSSVLSPLIIAKHTSVIDQYLLATYDKWENHLGPPPTVDPQATDELRALLLSQMAVDIVSMLRCCTRMLPYDMFMKTYRYCRAPVMSKGPRTKKRVLLAGRQGLTNRPANQPAMLLLRLTR